MSSPTFIILLTAINAICIALDRVMLNRHKPKLYESVIGFWYWLSELRISSFYKIVAEKVFNGIRWLLGKNGFAFRGILITCFISLFLTVIALLMSSYFGVKIMS